MTHQIAHSISQYVSIKKIAHFFYDKVSTYGVYFWWLHSLSSDQGTKRFFV